jgi:hypothetical protein
MLSPKESKKALIKIFRKRYVADLDQLFHVLETRSRMSVFRRLKLIGYLTSFTDAGRYYTLEEIPLFDSQGLWFHENIGFSKAGTLKATVVEIVNSSIAGMTPKEMSLLMKLRVPNTLHNTLHGLVKFNQIGRHRLQGLCLYTDAHSEKAQLQIEARLREKQAGVQPAAGPASTETTIAVLVEALQAGKVIMAPSEIASRLAVRGLSVTAEQVDRIFSQHGIQAGKKTLKYR